MELGLSSACSTTLLLERLVVRRRSAGALHPDIASGSALLRVVERRLDDGLQHR